MGARLGRYEIFGMLGEGGMASIYLGRLRGAEGFERAVAIKVLRKDVAHDTEYLRMFVDEACISAKLAHPNIVQIFELVREDGQLFMAMELLLGRPLADVWSECGARGVRLRPDVVAWIGARIAEGLHHAHELKDASGAMQNLVHRDVNPSNVFITYDGHVKVIDFGLVRATERLSRTATGIVKGKIAYLSPEQTMARPVDRRSDIFSLGATLWELSANRRLFRDETDVDTVNAIREARVEDPTRFVPGYPSLLWLVLRRALAKEPDDRYATAADFAKDLDGVARADGSILQAAALADIMSALFGDDRTRELTWVSDLTTREHTKLPAELVIPPRPAAAASDSALERAMPSVPYLISVVTALPAAAPPLMPPILERTEILEVRGRATLVRVIGLGLVSLIVLVSIVVAIWSALTPS
jgi:eukaryotic-like serine/threonine-protein kinase